ncbi:ROK family protein [Stygiobacter electus]|uniref:ROK family protein n=1 Tax=Stygiobacter electus TaxID=3032292 RepID=A0AAE3P282_9BACT|nr:ROK family protein [Stygiobacter electus]MDF1613062.1 ROK family protein [Stygiobacter electus]
MSVLGVDIGGTNIRVGLVENNSLVRIEKQKIKADGTEDEIIDEIKSLINRFSLNQIEGIGIGVPGVVDIEQGIVYDVQNIPSWIEVHLKEKLESKYHIPVYVNNDANCFAIGEKQFGCVKEYKNIVGLAIGTGLGAGLIINNHLYNGRNCGAGEFGMIPFKDHNYEYYCSGQFFKNEFGLTGKEMTEKAERGDKKALEIFAQFGLNLGEAIKMIMFAVDPEVIVLGGSISNSFKFFKDAMWNSVNEFPYGKAAENIAIKVSEIKYMALLGAAALYYDALSKNEINFSSNIRMIPSNDLLIK